LRAVAAKVTVTQVIDKDQYKVWARLFIALRVVTKKREENADCKDQEKANPQF
jgi:hypothetical protein